MHTGATGSRLRGLELRGRVRAPPDKMRRLEKALGHQLPCRCIQGRVCCAQGELFVHWHHSNLPQKGSPTDDLFFCHYGVIQDEAIHVHRVRQHKEFSEADPGDSPASLATGKQGRSLQSRHHGREILCCALLRTPPEPLQDQTTQAGYIAITGAEGGELRRITVNCDDQQRFLPWRNRAESQSPAHGFLPARTDDSGGVLHSPCEVKAHATFEHVQAPVQEKIPRIVG